MSEPSARDMMDFRQMQVRFPEAANEWETQCDEWELSPSDDFIYFVEGGKLKSLLLDEILMTPWTWDAEIGDWVEDFE